MNKFMGVDVGKIKGLSKTKDPDFALYVARVIADGGVIVDYDYLHRSILHAKDNGYWSSLRFWTSPSFGVKKDGSNAVSKMYCLKSSDIYQTTGSLQPIWTANQQNGKSTVYYNGNKYLRTASSVFPLGSNPRSTIAIFNHSRTVSDEWIINQGNNDYNGCRYNLAFQSIGFYVESRNMLYGTPLPSIGTTYLYSVMLPSTTTYSHVIYRNGALQTMTWGNNGTINTQSNYAATGISYQGYIADLMILNTSILDPVRTAIESYQNAYYAIY